MSTFGGNITHFYPLFYCINAATLLSRLWVGLEVFPGLPLLSFICESVFRGTVEFLATLRDTFRFPSIHNFIFSKSTDTFLGRRRRKPSKKVWNAFIQRFSKELLSSQLFSHYCRNINLSAPALHPSKWRLSIYSAALSPPHSCSAKTIFFAGKYLPPRKSDECPQGASQTWAISQVGLMICPQHVEFFFPYIIMKKIFEEGREEEEEKKAMTWPPDWLLILGT